MCYEGVEEVSEVIRERIICDRHEDVIHRLAERILQGEWMVLVTHKGVTTMLIV